MASGGFGGGVPHQDYPLPLARPPGIIFSRVNSARRDDVLNRTLQLQA